MWEEKCQAVNISWAPTKYKLFHSSLGEQIRGEQMAFLEELLSQQRDWMQSKQNDISGIFT